MDKRLEEQVWLRAHSRCEYCRFPSDFAEFPFHIDHIFAEKHGGLAESKNLALSCFYCNTSKGPNIAGVDPETKALTALFNPRTDAWAEHFRWDGPYLVGLSAVGRVTVAVLNINEPAAINVRHFLMQEGVYPA
ncbi:MAG: HNH endonuclease [Verrucomicrobiia bacterium]